MKIYIIRFIGVFIFLHIPFAFCPFSTTAKERIIMNIKQETELYKNYFKEQENNSSICDYLENYQKYIDMALSILNKELEKNKQLYRKIEKYGKFQKNKIILTKDKDIEIDEYSQYLKDNGIEIGYSEGSIFLYFDPMYIVLSFRDVLPNNVIEYYALESEDIKEGFQEDGALTIPWDYLRIKIERYEAYALKNRNINCSYIKKLTKKKINLYLRAYMMGLNNSPVYDYITEVKSSYEKFLSENNDSKFYEIIKRYYFDLKRNDFKFSRKEEVKNGVKYFGMTILDKNGKEVYIDDIAEKYMNYGTTFNN